MSEGAIYLVGPNGLKRMDAVRPLIEADPQKLIEDYPELISESDRNLLLLKREQASEGGVLDHLFVTRDAIPVLVEVKRWENPEIRRKIVAQMLDYAANNWATWEDGDAEQLFRERCISSTPLHVPEEILGEFVGPDINSSAFWSQVDQNMRDGTMKLLFVADEIPLELRRIVEFLNDQGMRAEVHAISLNYFRSEDGQMALAPQRFGKNAQTEARRARKAEGKPPISNEEWLDTRIGGSDSAARKGADVWLAIMEELEARTCVASAHGSIIAEISTWNGRAAYPLFLRHTKRVEICFRHNNNRGRLADETLRRTMLDRFANAVGSLTSNNLTGWPAFPVERLADPAIATAFREVAQKWIAICRNPDALE